MSSVAGSCHNPHANWTFVPFVTAPLRALASRVGAAVAPFPGTLPVPPTPSAVLLCTRARAAAARVLAVRSASELLLDNS